MLRTGREQQGFTLIELVMTLIIFAILSVVISQILFHGYQSFLVSQNIAENDWEGVLVLEKMVNDIHTIRSAGGLSTIQATQLAFTNVNGSSVQYQLSGGNLYRNSLLVANGVQNFSLGYLNKNGATTSSASAVRYISIAITLAQANQITSFVTLAGTRGIP